MTTRITVKNEGPDELLIRFYNAERQFKAEKTRLAVGESAEITVWDDNLPVMWPVGAAIKTDGNGRFYAVPPAHM